MAKIDLSQLDDFSDDFNEVITDEQIAVWDDAAKEFVPKDQGLDLHFRRVFMLMGG